jgi:hypothetical protein
VITRLLTVPTLASEVDVTATRTRGEVLAGRRALVFAQQDARRQLGEVQRTEWRLITGIDARARQIDRVLDELVARTGTGGE